MNTTTTAYTVYLRRVPPHAGETSLTIIAATALDAENAALRHVGDQWMVEAVTETDLTALLG